MMPVALPSPNIVGFKNHHAAPSVHYSPEGHHYRAHGNHNMQRDMPGDHYGYQQGRATEYYYPPNQVARASISVQGHHGGQAAAPPSTYQHQSSGYHHSHQHSPPQPGGQQGFHRFAGSQPQSSHFGAMQPPGAQPAPVQYGSPYGSQPPAPSYNQQPAPSYPQAMGAYPAQSMHPGSSAPQQVGFQGSSLLRSRDEEELEDYVWRKSGFSECSRTCAGGVQESIIMCIQRKTKAQVTDENCDPKKKPHRDVAPCKTQPCDKPEWFVKTNWSDCSSTCGQGRQTRVVECVHRIGPTPKEFVYVSASLCENDKKPPNVQNCRRRGCGVWSIGPWQECSSRCGRGFKSREVRCVDQANQLLPDSECDGPRPRDKDSCQGDSASCWFFTKWSDYVSFYPLIK